MNFISFNQLKIVFLFFSIVGVFLFGVFTKVSAQSVQEDGTVLYESKVVEVVEEKTEGQNIYQLLLVQLQYEDGRTDTVEIENGAINTVHQIRYEVGDKVLVALMVDSTGQVNFVITDFLRRNELLLLFGLFVFLAVAVGKLWGLSSLVGMAISFALIFKLLIPQILQGNNPVLVAIITSALIIPITFSLSHGITHKTAIAVAGTLITLTITGLLAVLFVNLTHLTGFGSEESFYLNFELAGTALNMKGLLLAGMIIASLGILDDITISQASIVNELKESSPTLPFQELFNRSMKVGRDHIASLVNTLVLVYAGASLPLMLLFINSSRPLSLIINTEMVAEEIVRTLVGSIGLILAVPVTSALAAWYYGRKDSLIEIYNS